ncbi:MAG TPA: hypothetical protein VJX23_04470 [Candidatus Binataceae bacterium]|nr:hypothetical protein [Candidatus Binataceae bacterium]
MRIALDWRKGRAASASEPESNSSDFASESVFTNTGNAFQLQFTGPKGCIGPDRCTDFAGSSTGMAIDHLQGGGTPGSTCVWRIADSLDISNSPHTGAVGTPAQRRELLHRERPEALSTLWKNQKKKKEARQVFSVAYGRFTEGFETTELKAAKSLPPDQL